MAKKAWTIGNFVYLRTGWLKIASFSLALSHRFQLTIFGFPSVSFSRRVYVRSLCCENPASFIMKLELMIMQTKFRTKTRLERETEGNAEMVYSSSKKSCNILTLHCIICDF